jgi:hypothetical protein
MILFKNVYLQKCRSVEIDKNLFFPKKHTNFRNLKSQFRATPILGPIQTKAIGQNIGK